EKRSGYFRRRESAEQTQRECHLGARIQRWMTTGKYQPQHVITHDRLLVRLILRRWEICIGMALLARALTPVSIDRPITRRRDDPSCRAWRKPGGWPTLECRDKSVLYRFLGIIDATEDTNQNRYRTPRSRRKTRSISSTVRFAMSVLSLRLPPGKAAPRWGAWLPGPAYDPTPGPHPDREPSQW